MATITFSFAKSTFLFSPKMLKKFLFAAVFSLSNALNISFTAYEHGEQNSFMRGNTEKLYLIDDECGELQNVHDKITSIDTNGACIILYEDRRCQGKSVIIKPGCTDESCCSPDSLVYCGFNDRASSYRACPNPWHNVIFWFITILLIFAIGFLLVGIALPYLRQLIRHFRMPNPLFNHLINVNIYATSNETY